MKNISKNISTVCRFVSAIRNARKLQLEHTRSRQNMRYYYLQKHSQRSLRIRFTSGSLYCANDNRVSNCAIDCRQDLINYAVPIPPVLRVTILYTFMFTAFYIYRAYYVIDQPRQQQFCVLLFRSEISNSCSQLNVDRTMLSPSFLVVNLS